MFDGNQRSLLRRTYAFYLSNFKGGCHGRTANQITHQNRDVTPTTQSTKAPDWQPFDALRNQVDRLFHDFQTGFLQAPSYRSGLDMEPFWRRDLGFSVTPAIDIVEKEKAFEVTADLPGLDAKNIELQLSDNVLTIKGEKQEGKEEKTKDRYVSERRYGSSAARSRYPAASTPKRSKRTSRTGSDRHPSEVSGSAEEAEDDPGFREEGAPPASPCRAWNGGASAVAGLQCSTTTDDWRSAQWHTNRSCFIPQPVKKSCAARR